MHSKKPTRRWMQGLLMMMKRRRNLPTHVPTPDLPADSAQGWNGERHALWRWDCSSAWKRAWRWVKAQVTSRELQGRRTESTTR
jgi:hypothetical protein